MAGVIARAVARLLVVIVPCQTGAIWMIADAEFIRAWRENRP